jgi:hypothetical protein
MPTVTVAIWNVQNYGAGNPARKWGAGSLLRNQFITALADELSAEVLLLQEVSVNALGSLQNLATSLNAGASNDWAVSFCGSALAPGAANPPANAGQLTFQTDGRSEGYAVCWRTNVGDRYTMVNGAHQIASVHPPIAQLGSPTAPATTPLNMVTTGRPIGPVDVYVQTGRKRKFIEQEINAIGGYRPANLFPYDENNALMASWPNLEFPTTSTKNPRDLRWTNVRRPVYVVLDLPTAAGADQRLMPVIAYHAPSNEHKAGWGALLGGLSRELYVADGVDAMNNPDPVNPVSIRRTVFGGDFNYAVADNYFPAEYMYFTKDFAVSEKAGAQCRVAPSTNTGDARRTTIQLMDVDNTTPITSADLNAYYRYPIDLIFFRGFPADHSAGRRYNFLPELRNAGNAYAAVLNAFGLHLTALAAGLAGPNQRMAPGVVTTGPQEYIVGEGWKAMICGSWGATFLDWNAFVADLGNGFFSNARRTAEFTQMFISDHLPVVCEIDF